jgi:two-component system, response regulator PdtaR
VALDVAQEAQPEPEKAAVLVVEDEVLIRLMIADALRAQGIGVIEASNGDEAQAVLASSIPIDLLLTDIRMPSKMDGLALARFARAARPKLKLIIASSESADSCGSEVADAFFHKPYTVSALLRSIKSLLKVSDIESKSP